MKPWGIATARAGWPWRVIVSALLAGGIVAGLHARPAFAGPPSAAARAQSKIVLHFTERDRDLIREYFTQPASGLPPGLAKRKSLPPGLQKQLREKGRLPPGLQKRLLPGELERRLSALPAGYERVIVGNDVLLIETATRIVLDILRDVLR